MSAPNSHRKALERALTAMNDWVNTYASEMCDQKYVEEAWKRISDEGGTLAYIANVAEDIRVSLARPDGPSDDGALLDWAETHPEEAMRLLTTWWATAGRGCRETRFEFRNIFRSGQSATDGSGQ